MQITKVRLALFFTLLIVITLGFGYVLKPFFYPIFWAAVLASVFYPLYSRINKKINKPRLTSLVMLILIILIILVPLSGISSLLIRESIDIYTEIDNNRSEIISNAQGTLDWIQNLPFMEGLNIDKSFWVEKISDTAKALTAFIFTSIKNFTQNSVVFLVMFVLMIYTLYFFFKDGARFLEKAMHLIPLGNKYEKILYEKFTSASRAALTGTLIVGGVQGVLGGLMFVILGIKGAAIWGIIMVLVSIVPIGPSVIWFPASIVLFINGQVWQGVTLLIFGVLVISTVDNFLRPILVGKQTKLHPLLILFSTLGGILLFGFTGFLIGPILTALVISMWEIYDEHYKDELLKY